MTGDNRSTTSAPPQGWLTPGKSEFAITMRGDSMENPSDALSIPKGAKLIFDFATKPVPGCFVFAAGKTSRDAPRVRQFIVQAGKRYLRPLNPRYRTRLLPKDAHIFGVLRGSVIGRDYWTPNKA